MIRRRRQGAYTLLGRASRRGQDFRLVNPLPVQWGRSSSGLALAAFGTRLRFAATAARTSVRSLVRIFHAMKNVGTHNPVIHVGCESIYGYCDFRGDPASALLEVLDPEQNSQLYGSLPRLRSTTFPRYSSSRLPTYSIQSASRCGTGWRSRKSMATRKTSKYQIAKRYLLTKQIGAQAYNRRLSMCRTRFSRQIISDYTREVVSGSSNGSWPCSAAK